MFFLYTRQVKRAKYVSSFKLPLTCSQGQNADDGVQLELIEHGLIPTCTMCLLGGTIREQHRGEIQSWLLTAK